MATNENYWIIKSKTRRVFSKKSRANAMRNCVTSSVNVWILSAGHESTFSFASAVAIGEIFTDVINNQG